MAHVAIPYGADPVSLSTPRESEAWKRPAGAEQVCAYLVASQGQYSSQEWEWALTLGFSVDGANWTWLLPTRATGDTESIAPHGDGLEPGQIPAGVDSFTFTANNAQALCQPWGSFEYARIRISAQQAPAGTSAAFIAAVIESQDANGNTVNFDPAERIP